MKIAHVISTFPPKIGGMGRVCWEEAEGMAKRGHEVTVFTLDYPEAGKKIANYFKVVNLKTFLKMGDAGWVPQLLKLLKGFDLVHLHYPFYGGAEFVWLAKVLQGQKYVVTYHMDARPTTAIKQFIQAIYDDFFPDFIFSRAEKVIMIDQEHFYHSRFGAKINSKKVVMLANGVNIEVFKPHVIDWLKLGWPQLKNKKVTLFVGNALPVKRLDIAIEAIKKLGKDAVLLVVGGGYDVENYKKMTVGFEQKIFFAGFCQEVKILADFYAAADCVIIPSDKESFSLVAIEAMASGCLVVGSNIPGLRERITDEVDGFLAQAGSAEDFAIKIRRALLTPKEEKDKMTTLAKSRVINNYSGEDHIVKLEKIYQEALSKIGVNFNYESSIWGRGEAELSWASPTKERLERAISILPNEAGAEVLEIGCGAGQFIRAIKKNRPELVCYGADISVEAIKQAKITHDQVQYDLSQENSLPYTNSTMDAVLIFDVLEHVANPIAILSEANRILKPNGKLYAFVPCEGDKLSLWHWLDKINWKRQLTKKYAGHINYFTRQQLSELIEKNGFKIIKQSYSEHFFGQILGVITFYLMDKKAKKEGNRQINNEQFFAENKKQMGMWGTILRIVVNFLINLETELLGDLPSPNVHIVAIKK